MNTKLLTASALAAVVTSFALAADETNPIKDAMKFAHKAPKGEKKLSEKIIEGNASDEEVKKTLEFYKLMVNSKPPKGDQADFKAKVTKLVASLEEVVAKKPDGIAHYKTAVDCKACHSEHKADPPKP